MGMNDGIKGKTAGFRNQKLSKLLFIVMTGVIAAFLIWNFAIPKENRITMPMSMAYGGEDIEFPKEGDWDIEDNYDENTEVEKKSDKKSEKVNKVVVIKPKTETETKQKTQAKSATSSEYILQDSGVKLLSRSDVEGLSLQEIDYAKNEIYARRGRKFKSPELQNYFNSKSWYIGAIEAEAFGESLLSDVEKKNAEFLSEIEFSMNPKGYQLDAD